MAELKRSEPCPCGSGRPEPQCCGALHRAFAESGALPAASAEALMRSRYTAFVRDRRDYLLATWHPRTRPATLEPPPPGLRWLGLEILQVSPTTVRFVARSKVGGRAHRMEETSRFECLDGVWLYVDGELA